MVRITTWNVNGIRNPFGYKPWSNNRTFSAMFDILEADIVIMQELKIQRKDLTDDMVLIPGWDCYFSLPKHKKGLKTKKVLKSAANIIKATLALASLLGSLYARLSMLRKEYWEFFVRLAQQHHIASFPELRA